MQDFNNCPHVNIVIDYDDHHPENSLCCCEYFDHNQERTHLLACCCNCSEFDQCCENLLCCNGISRRQASRVMSIIANRLRFPWGGGARRMSFDALCPLFLIPLMLFLAAQGVWYTFGVFMCLPLALGYLHNYIIKFKPDSKFFLSWTITTIVLSMYMFQTMSPYFLITTEENLACVVLFSSSVYCLVRARYLAKSSHVKTYSYLPSSSTESIVNISDDSVSSLTTSFNIGDGICPECRKQIPARAYHCSICNVCVLKRDLHCVWLDCCIGEKNHRFYLLGIILLMCYGFLVSDLMLITLCLPVKVFFTVQLPEDCSEVYEDIMLTQYFVLAIYLLIISFFLLSLVCHEFYMISFGITGHEWRISSNRCFYCLRRASVYSRGVWENWYNFLTNNS